MNGNFQPSSTATMMRESDVDKQLARIDRLSWLMDESVRLPGGFRVGVDGLIGLIPGFGDVGGFVVSLFIINEARRLGVTKTLLARMLFNVTLETVIGVVPIAGDLFDFYFKANIRNLALLRKHFKRAT